MDNDNTIPTIATAWGADVFPLLSWFRQDRLDRARVMVVGCGALGNEVLKNLALFGVGHLAVVDFDSVEPSNLTRSILFGRADAEARRAKVDAVAARIRAINPAIEVLPLRGDICHDVGLGLLRRMDVVVGCMDNRWARYCLNRLCMRAGVAWVDGGIDGLEGTARVFMPGRNCYACTLGPEALKDLSYRLSCSSVVRRNEAAGRAPTTPVIASVIGAVQAQEAVKLLHPDQLASGELTSLCGRMFYYEGQHCTSRVVEFAGYDDGCPEHERWQPVEETDLDTGQTVGEVLESLSARFGCRRVEIHLRNHCFVDYLLTRRDERRVEVMLPDYAVGRRVEEDPVLGGLPLHTLYQHELKTLGPDFPYPELTLARVGIPPWDVLHVDTELGVRYVELADERAYSTFLYSQQT